MLPAALPMRLAPPDLGPLAWVLDDVRRSLHSATNAVRRFVWDLKTGANADATTRDSTEIRMAGKQFHQSAGALEMVDQSQPAKILRALEALAHTVVEQPQTCTEELAHRVERACRALVDYLEGLLKGSQASPVALFPQQRAVMELSGALRIHPADLWPQPWHWQPVAVPGMVAPLQYAPGVRSAMAQALLPILKTLDPAQALQMAALCNGLAVGESSPQGPIFWAVAAGFFDAMAVGALPDDVYVRRTAAQTVAQYGVLAAGQGGSLDRVAHDFLFYCALAPVPDGNAAPLLKAVRHAYGLDQHPMVDYEIAPFGRFDPAQLAALHKQMGTAAESWSALAGGDVGRAPAVAAQFAALSEAVCQLHPESVALATALNAAAETPARSARIPSPALALEVATSLLYLEVAYDDPDLSSHTLEQRSARLAARLRHAAAGGTPQPVERWMEALYRRVGDRKTMGTVVVELGLSLAALEKSLDAYVRDPADTAVLEDAPTALGHMRGVFAVLGLEQAALAAARMRSYAEQLLAPAAAPTDTLKKRALQLVNSLSAMGFLIDMLRYQPALAKELFVYDEESGEFRLGQDREQALAQAGAFAQVAAFGTQDADASAPEPRMDVLSGSQAAAFAPPSDGPTAPVLQPNPAVDDDVHGIFLAEAREVVCQGQDAIAALALASAHSPALGTLRRAFHTLKGSARMVGLHDFGDAAWSCEQLLNAWMAEQRAVSAPLLALCEDALDALARWIDAIAQGQAAPFTAREFQRCADPLRLENRYTPFLLSPPTDVAPAATPDGPMPPPPPPLEPAEPVEPLEREPSVPLAAAGPGDEAPALAPSLYQSAVLPAATPGAPPPHVIAIGDLRFGLEFFEVFVNEAYAWAQQLQSEIDAWDAAAQQPAPSGAVALAHSLRGSSAAVGFTGLSGLSRALEHALAHVALHALCGAEHKAVLSAAAHEVSRLLDAFSSGTLVDPSASTLHALAGLLHTSAPAPLAAAQERGRPDARAGELPLGAGTQAQEQEPPAPLLLPQQPVSTAAPPAPAAVPVRGWIAAPAPLAASLEQVEELESQDLLDAELLPIFLDEGLELFSVLGMNLRCWVAQPEQLDFRAQALRVLHTLKGSARLAGALRVGELAHRMESVIESLGGVASSQTAEIAPCLRYLDQLQALFDGLAGARLAEGPGALEAALKSAPPPAVADTPHVPAPPPAAALRSMASQSVRVRAQVLDRLIDQAGEVMISRARMDGRVGQLRGALGELGRNLERLRQQLRDLELQAELQMQSRLTQTPEASPLFDPLEFDRFTRVQEVSRMMAESLADVDAVHKSLHHAVEGAQDDVLGQGRRAKVLQQDLLRMRLVEFEKISDRLYGVVRQASKDAGKPVRLDIVGGQIEVDRGVLDRMTPAFEHLLRNAVAHGIESAAERLAAGKPASGAISISVHQDGSDVSVTFADDGGGLQIEKIRAQAVAAKLLEPEQALSAEDAARFLFIAGFSTADQVTELAGRGIGMDVVLSDVSAVGGRIETVSHAGQGTRFTVVFPLTTAVTQVVMLRMGAVTMGVPANLLETVLRVPAPTLAAAYASGALSYGDLPAVPFFWAGALLSASARSAETAVRQHAVAVIRSAGQRVALHVDEVLGSREVVVKNLGPQLSRLPGLAGMSVLASGAVVLIYNPVALASLYGDTARQVQAEAWVSGAGPALDSVPASLAAVQAPLVLVVDDSITVRRVTQRLLQREGYRVALASDGLQALELLQDERPAVVLLDIEMPRMDGLELARNIRRTSDLAELPLVVITSRMGSKHREHAAALGVNHYLGKPYSDAELLALVRTYCLAPEPVSNHLSA